MNTPPYTQRIANRPTNSAMTTTPSTSDIFQEALQQLLAGEALAPFCDWFATTMAAALQQSHPVGPDDASGALRYQRHVARQLWGGVPVPSNRWRARGVPKVDRNAPCHCGSGRKFKQCCAEFEHMPLPLGADDLLVMALDAARPEMLLPEKLRQVPAQALGEVAMSWNQEGQAEKTAALLGPLFTDPSSLDERHELALDALMDALQTLGQERQRRDLMERMAQHSDKVLATTARARLVSVLADQGELERSWKLFHETSRFSPNDPQLWTLELTLLLSQGREEEARLRAPLLAARARKVGLDDLAGALLRMAQEGLGAVADFLDEDIDTPEDLDWIALANATPASVDTELLRSLYRVDRFPLEDSPDATVSAVSIRPVKKLADLNLRWRRRFLVGKPDLTWLDGDVDTLMESLPEALAFLQKNPSAWLSAEVLDDLLLGAYALCDHDSPRQVLAAAQRVADHALAVLRALVGNGQFHWIEHDNRPMLRCLALAVELCHLTDDMDRGLALMQWGLALNPNDNHGWRAQVAPMLVEKGQHQAALDLMARYPDDLPPSEHVRAVALFGLGRRDEAEAVLRRAHQAHPVYLNMLLPEAMDPPPEEPGPGIRLGGTTSAWYHRLEWRPMWVRVGALAWARGLNLPDPPPKAPKAPTKPPAKKSARATRPVLGSFGKREEARLRKTCSDYPRLHGLLTAVAWSPQMLMPSNWLPLVMELHDRMPNSRTEATANKALNDTLDATMKLYNHVNQHVLDSLSDQQPPLGQTLNNVVDGDNTACAWAAGFLIGCETTLAAWARSGHKVTGQTGAFGRLRALAARAPLRNGQPPMLLDNGSPLLQAIEESTPARVELEKTLKELWPTVLAHRLQRG